MKNAFRLATVFSVITLTSMTALPAMAEQLKVVATFSIIGDFAKNVGGERIALTTLVGPNGDAHVYEPRPADAAVVSQADVILMNGLHFEGFLNRLIEASGTKAAVTELTKGVKTLENKEDDAHAHDDAGHDDHKHGDHKHGDHKHDDQKHDDHKHEDHRHDKHAKHDDKHDHDSHEGHDHGPVDPHAFQSIANAIIYVKNIADAFCAADADGCDFYRANATAYTDKLSELETAVKADVDAIPSDKRTVITSHDAFGYFSQAYGIKFLAPEGISTEAEASAADVAQLIRQIREDNASAIFVENITNQRLIEQISAETGLKIGGTLYSDALSDAAGPASTYIDLMRNNITTIKTAIVGS